MDQDRLQKAHEEFFTEIESIEDKARGSLCDELISELVKLKPSKIKCEPWNEVRRSLEKAVQGISDKHMYWLSNAFNTVVRLRFGIKNVREMNSKDVEEAIKMIPGFIRMAGIGTVCNV